MKIDRAWPAMALGLWMWGGAQPANAVNRCSEALQSMPRDVPMAIAAAIMQVESGGNQIALNLAGLSLAAGSTAAAAALVRQAQTEGRCIDIGCMQVNSCFHQHRVADLVELLDPVTNVRVAAEFLRELRRQRGTWIAAAGAYHSSTPKKGAAYRCRLAEVIDPTHASAACFALRQ